MHATMNDNREWAADRDNLDLAAEIKRNANVAARHYAHADRPDYETEVISDRVRDGWRNTARRHEELFVALVDEARARLDSGSPDHVADLLSDLDLYAARHLVEQTGLELEESTWPAYALDGRKVTATAARQALEPYGERIRWALVDELDTDDVGAARYVAEELEQDGTPYMWTYRGDSRAELERAIVTWAMSETDEPRGTGGRNWIQITDRRA